MNIDNNGKLVYDILVLYIAYLVNVLIYNGNHMIQITSHHNIVDKIYIYYLNIIMCKIWSATWNRIRSIKQDYEIMSMLHGLTHLHL